MLSFEQDEELFPVSPHEERKSECMSVMKELAQQKRNKDKKKQPLFANVADALDTEGAISWSAIDTATVIDAIITLSEAGAMITFARSRDGGALTLSVYHNGDSKRWYEHNTTKIETLLTELTAAAQSVRD